MHDVSHNLQLRERLYATTISKRLSVSVTSETVLFPTKAGHSQGLSGIHCVFYARFGFLGYLLKSLDDGESQGLK